MDNNEVMDVVETENTEVAETSNNETGIKLTPKTVIGGVAVGGLLLGAGFRLGEKVVDGGCQLAYNLKRTIQDTVAEGKEKAEQKKAEREAKYQEEKAKKEEKKAEKEQHK